LWWHSPTPCRQPARSKAARAISQDPIASACRPRGLVEAPADQRHGPASVQRPTLDAAFAAAARPLQRRVQPPEPFIVAPEPRLRSPVQQREVRRSVEIARISRAEVRDDLGVAASRGKLLSLID